MKYRPYRHGQWDQGRLLKPEFFPRCRQNGSTSVLREITEKKLEFTGALKPYLLSTHYAGVAVQ